MNHAHTLTIKIPLELKQRLEKEALHQGTSLDQLTSYLITTQLTQLVKTLGTGKNELACPLLGRHGMFFLFIVPVDILSPHYYIIAGESNVQSVTIEILEGIGLTMKIPWVRVFGQ